MAAIGVPCLPRLSNRQRCVAAPRSYPVFSSTGAACESLIAHWHFARCCVDSRRERVRSWGFALGLDLCQNAWGFGGRPSSKALSGVTWVRLPASESPVSPHSLRKGILLEPDCMSRTIVKEASHVKVTKWTYHVFRWCKTIW